MANGLNNLITVFDLINSSAAYDAVAVLNGFEQVIEAARPVRATVRQPSRLLDHPLENGQVITDYSVILPVEIDLTVIVQVSDYRSTAQEIISLFQNKDVLTVQLKAATYVNMVIADIPHEETPEKFDAFLMTIRFRQILVVESSPSFNPADPTQADTQSLGQQQATPAMPVTNPPVQTVPGVTIAPTTEYSSVQNLSGSGYTISGVATPNGQAQTITNAAPTSNFTTTGAATMTSDTSIASSFGGVPSTGGLGLQ